jgi:hypothetical protein
MTTLQRIENMTFYGPDGCWYWTGYLNAKGYGCIRVSRKTLLAHRVNYELLVSPIPSGLIACHSCDNPSCINPHHIFIGTMSDNMKDMVIKGRSPKNLGEKNPNRILTAELVLEIRAKKSTMTYKAISSTYGITKDYAWNLVHNKSWKHI